MSGVESQSREGVHHEAGHLPRHLCTFNPYLMSSLHSPRASLILCLLYFPEVTAQLPSAASLISTRDCLTLTRRHITFMALCISFEHPSSKADFSYIALSYFSVFTARYRHVGSRSYPSHRLGERAGTNVFAHLSVHR